MKYARQWSTHFCQSTLDKRLSAIFLFAVSDRREENLQKYVRLFLCTTLTSCVTNGYALTISLRMVAIIFHTLTHIPMVGVWAWMAWIRHTSTQSTIHLTHHVYEGEKSSNKRLMIKYYFFLVSLVCCTGNGFSLWVYGPLYCVCVCAFHPMKI